MSGRSSRMSWTRWNTGRSSSAATTPEMMTPAPRAAFSALSAVTRMASPTTSTWSPPPALLVERKRSQSRHRGSVLRRKRRPVAASKALMAATTPIITFSWGFSTVVGASPRPVTVVPSRWRILGHERQLAWQVQSPVTTGAPVARRPRHPERPLGPVACHAPSSPAGVRSSFSGPFAYFTVHSPPQQENRTDNLDYPSLVERVQWNGKTKWAAFVLDLPGCVVVVDSLDELPSQVSEVAPKPATVREAVATVVMNPAVVESLADWLRAKASEFRSYE